MILRLLYRLLRQRLERGAGAGSRNAGETPVSRKDTPFPGRLDSRFRGACPRGCKRGNDGAGIAGTPPVGGETPASRKDTPFPMDPAPRWRRAATGPGGAPASAATGGAPGRGIFARLSRRRLPAMAALVLCAGALAAAGLGLLALPPASRPVSGNQAAALHLEIPAVGAKPMLVYLRGAGLDPPRPGAGSSPVHRISSVDGRFSPEFQVVPPAGILEMSNADSIPHNIHVFNRGETVFNVALPEQGVAVRKVLAGYEVFDVRCDLHPGMKAWMFVPPSKHYAVVHDPGTIRFTGIPPGDHVLHLWEPDRGESLRPLSLGAGETRRLRLR